MSGVPATGASVGTFCHRIGLVKPTGNEDGSDLPGMASVAPAASCCCMRTHASALTNATLPGANRVVSSGQCCNLVAHLDWADGYPDVVCGSCAVPLS